MYIFSQEHETILEISLFPLVFFHCNTYQGERRTLHNWDRSTFSAMVTRILHVVQQLKRAQAQDLGIIDPRSEFW